MRKVGNYRGMLGSTPKQKNAGKDKENACKIGFRCAIIRIRYYTKKIVDPACKFGGCLAKIYRPGHYEAVSSG